MNKKELSEIRKNFNDNSGFFTLNRVLTVFVDPQKNILCKENKLYALIPEDEGIVIMELLKKVLSGSLAKNLVEYSFPNAEYNEGGAQNILYSVVNSKLEDNAACDNLINKIVENMEYSMAYTLIIGFCSYSIMSSDEDNDTDEYNFIVAAVCPVSTSNDGLMYDRENSAIIKKDNSDPIVSRVPTDGFFFPVFSDRAPDVNNVMYYTKTPKKPNISIVNDVLGCEFVMSCQREKEAFQYILKEVVSDELNYTVINQVNDALRDIVLNARNETEMPIIDDSKLYEILFDAGVSVEKLDVLKDVFKEVSGAVGLKAENLIEKKTVLSTPDITVNIKSEAVDKVRTSVMNGRKCLVIDIDDPTVFINGIDVRLS